jgi:hypothetical protein
LIPTDRIDAIDAGIAVLEDFARRTGAKGRFIALYLGLRRMGDSLARMGSDAATSSLEIEEFMDQLLTKQHREEPFVVLSAPFGGSTSATAPYSPRTGVTAPGKGYPTNTWRNNFGIQKGVGCPAEPDTIERLLASPERRLACPHMVEDADGQHSCSIESTSYRGEEHSIWLRRTADGLQKANLDDPATYGSYLEPSGERVPIFPLISVLYCDAPAGTFPARAVVGIPDFAEDFDFTVQQVEQLFDCDPQGAANATLLRTVQRTVVVSRPDAVAQESSSEAPDEASRLPVVGPLPDLRDPILLNSGLGAELAVAADLTQHGWQVGYRGNQSGVGYDLEAQQASSLLCVEVKSSIGFTAPELTESEWAAAQEHGDHYVLAVVDFYGSPKQQIWYVRDPAGTVTPAERTTTVYRLPRSPLQELGTEAEFL